jgi:uncharacterized membrane protein HdeD (DUF308 family)
MSERNENTPFFARPTYRLLSGIFGVFLVCVGLYVLLFAGPLTALSLIAGVALVALGGNLTISAVGARESWLSRIGPLP